MSIDDVRARGGREPEDLLRERHRPRPHGPTPPPETADGLNAIQWLNLLVTDDRELGPRRPLSRASVRAPGPENRTRPREPNPNATRTRTRTRVTQHGASARLRAPQLQLVGSEPVHRHLQPACDGRPARSRAAPPPPRQVGAGRSPSTPSRRGTLPPVGIPAERVERRLQPGIERQPPRWWSASSKGRAAPRCPARAMRTAVSAARWRLKIASGSGTEAGRTARASAVWISELRHDDQVLARIHLHALEAAPGAPMQKPPSTAAFALSGWCSSAQAASRIRSRPRPRAPSRPAGRLGERQSRDPRGSAGAQSTREGDPVLQVQGDRRLGNAAGRARRASCAPRGCSRPAGPVRPRR